MLSGYKTYITGVLAILGAIGAYLAGDMTVVQAVQVAIPALMLMFVRHGVATS